MKLDQFEKLNGLLVNGDISLDEISELVPGWLHLNSINDFSLVYISPRMETDFGIKKDLFQQGGHNFLASFIHPETTERVIPQLKELVASGDYSKVISFFQYIKTPATDYQWFHTNTKLLEGRDCTISITNPVSVLEDFEDKVVDILNDYIYLKNNLTRYNDLTRREKEVLKLLSEGKSHKELADKLMISELTVKTHRQNIYRKLEVSNMIELIRFAYMFGLK